MDYSDIKKVVEETNVEIVQKYLDTGRWRVLAVAPGYREDGSAYHLYALGWYGPVDGSDHSEFPNSEEKVYGWQ